MSIIVLDAIREVTDEGYYLEWNVASSSFVDDHIFIHRNIANTFEHVASADEMVSYPAGPESSANFYRLPTASVTHTDIDKAVALIDIVKNKVDILVEDYDKLLNNFTGSETSSHVF